MNEIRKVLPPFQNITLNHLAIVYFDFTEFFGKINILKAKLFNI